MKLSTLQKKGSNAKIKDFISFYSKIPAKNWCRFYFKEGNKYCARGHLRTRALTPNELDYRIMEIAPQIAAVNNGYYEDKIVSVDTKTDNPKTRVLKYLKSLNKG